MNFGQTSSELELERRREVMAETEVTAVFVYGTLKRGECRESCWPRAPLRVETAATKGQLYDLGPYPALCPGEGSVAGEVWTFAPRDMPATRAALDEIEDHHGDSDAAESSAAPQKPAAKSDETTEIL